MIVNIFLIKKLQKMNRIVDSNLKKLFYRAKHRGFKEADIIIGSFADKHLHTFSESEAKEFEIILELPDNDIYDWYMGKSPIPQELSGPVLTMLMQHKVPTSAA